MSGRSHSSASPLSLLRILGTSTSLICSLLLVGTSEILLWLIQYGFFVQTETDTTHDLS